MTPSFTLRAMHPDDGPALQRLMETDPVSSGLSMTTLFQMDAYQAWVTLKPDLIGVVAEAPDFDGLAAAVTISFDDVQADGRVVHGAYLENLKVDYRFRGQRLGAQVVAAVAEQARARIGADGVIFTGMSSDNTASMASMKSWSKQVFGPLAVAARPPRSSAPKPLPGITVRPAEPYDYAEIAAKSNRFYADYNLYTPLSADRLSALLGRQPQVYRYHVAVDADGNLLAGALLTDRGRLMVDEVRSIPAPLKLMNNVIHLLPADNRIRLMEANLFWFDSLAAGRQLWNGIRWDFRAQASTITAAFDQRSLLRDVFQIRPWHMPKIAVSIVVGGPSALSADRLICNAVRG